MSQSPRVLHVIHSGAIGGGPQVVLDLATAVKGTHVVVSAADGPLLDDARERGIEVMELTRSGEFSFAVNIPFLARATRNVDLVHLHGQFAAFYGSIAAALGRVPAVYTAHFPSFVTDWTAPRRARNLVAEKVPCRLARYVVACSNSSREEYLRRGLVSGARISTIYNGVRDRRTERSAADVRAELRASPDDPVVLAIGRFSPQKGFGLLLDALPIVQSEVPRVKAVFVGDGELRQELEVQAVKKGLDKSVRFTGFRRDTRDLLEASTLVAVPSRYDIFPLVPLEAMMAERAVVATDIPALREAVTDNITGLIVPQEPEAFAAALIQLLHDADRRERMGRLGREVALRSFSSERMTEEYSSLYTRLLHGALS